MEHLVLKYEAGLTESQASNIKWGFRPEKWLEDRHGAKKAKMLITRKLAMGLPPGCTKHRSSLKCREGELSISNEDTVVGLSKPRWIQDPELPDDEEEKLFFTMINLDMSNVTEVRRLTKLEMEGCIDQAGLDEFVKASPISHLQSI